MLYAALFSLAVMTAPAADKAKPATNTVDPICKMKTTPKDQTVAVRGQEYRVCSKHCAGTLQKDPDKYLEKDGSVKGAK